MKPLHNHLRINESYCTTTTLYSLGLELNMEVHSIAERFGQSIGYTRRISSVPPGPLNATFASLAKGIYQVQSRPNTPPNTPPNSF